MVPSPDSAAANADDRPALTAVLIEPRAPHTDDDVLKLLQAAGTTQVSQLAPGFISAALPAELLARVSEIADVTVKTRKQLRPGNF